MPRDSQGAYSLPNGYLAQTGETILASQHNPPLEDIAQALTGSLPRNGAAGMQAPLSLFAGSAAEPGITFGNGIGIFRTSGGNIGFSVAGVQVAEVTPNGITAGIVGQPIPVLDDVLPPLSLWANGQNVSRATYAKLFTKWGTKYGVGDGSTTFGMPDLRGRGLIGKDNFGGTDASRLAGVTFTSGDRLTTGSTLGAALVALVAAEIAAHTHGATIPHPSHGYVNNIAAAIVGGPGGVALGQGISSQPTAQTFPPAASAITTASAGSGTAHLNVQPSLTCGWAIYAGE